MIGHSCVLRCRPEVLTMLRAPHSSRKKQSLLGKAVCAQAFRRLVGFGSGRFLRLKDCVKNNIELAPLDRRMLPRKKLKVSPERIQIIEFLTELYNTIAEPMPESTGGGQGGPKHIAFRKHRGRRPKIASKFAHAQKEAKAKAKMCKGDNKGQPSAIRMLPPGTFSDYLAQYWTKRRGSKASLKLFNNALWPHIICEFHLLRQ